MNEIIKQRFSKLKELEELNIQIYPNYFKRTHTIQSLLEQIESTKENTCIIAGRIRTKRPMGKAGFLTIFDQSNSIQIYANDKTLDHTDFIVFQKLDIGDIIGVSGAFFYTKKGEASIRASKIKILSKNLSPLPIVKTAEDKTYDAFEDTELRYRKRYLDLAVNQKNIKDFILRSKIIQSIRDFLLQDEFYEVETPMLQTIASGAAAKPFTTHHNALNIPLQLRIAPELHLKRLIVGGFEKVFELNRNFRNEGISSKHNPEFTMLEIYQAYTDYNDMIKLLESIISNICNTIFQKTQFLFGEHEIKFTTPFIRKTYLELLEDKLGIPLTPYISKQEKDTTKLYEIAKKNSVTLKHNLVIWDILDELFSTLVEPTLIQPTFVIDYPKVISPLAKSKPNDEFFVERFELYVAGREIANAYSELNDPIEQENRFKEQQQQKQDGVYETIEMDKDFLEALKVGMPPTGGLGIGIDRIVMIFLNKTSIKDVILFPLLRPENPSI